MGHQIQKLVWLFLLWILFSVGCIAAPVLALAFPILKRFSYPRQVLHAADRLCAALLGFNGRNMLSTELAQTDHWMHGVLNTIEKNHCEESAYAEGAYCRLSDRRLGNH